MQSGIESGLLQIRSRYMPAIPRLYNDISGIYVRKVLHLKILSMLYSVFGLGSGKALIIQMAAAVHFHNMPVPENKTGKQEYI